MASRTNETLNRAGVALAIGLSGCGVERAASKSVEPSTASPAVERPAATPTNRAALEKSVQTSLDRLRELEPFTTGQVVLKLPESATNCYGVCPGWRMLQRREANRRPRRSAAHQGRQARTKRCSTKPRPRERLPHHRRRGHGRLRADEHP
jgi:hypothetical protein